MPGSSRPTRRNVLLAMVAVGLALAMLLVPLPNADRSAWKSALLDLGHAPLLAVITWTVWRLFGRRLLMASFVAIGLALLSEGTQMLVERTPSLGDLASNCSGVLAAAVIIWGWSKPRTVARVSSASLVALALIAWPATLAGPVLIDAWRALRDYPVLSDFSHASEIARWRRQHVEFDWLGPGAGSFRFVEGGGSDIVMFPVIRDWTEYNHLCCELTVAEGPVTIQFSIRDGKSIDQLSRRFRRTETLATGEHRICFDLNTLAAGGQYVPVDTRRVQSFHTIVKSPERPRTLIVRRVYLE